MVPNGTAYSNYPPFANNGTKTPPGGSPESAKYALGMVPADTFPAEWANYLFHGATAGITRLNTDVGSIKKEINSVLEAFGITNDASVFNQLLGALNKIYAKFTSCDTAAITETKLIAVQGDVLKAGNVYVIDMTNGNTYGDGSTTYPKLSVNSGTAYPICDASGQYVGSGAWAAGDTITVLFTGSKFLMATPAAIDTITQSSPLPITSGAIARIEPIDEVALQQTRPPTSNAVSAAMSYSTTETFTGSYWIDGKPIYRKVITNSWGSSGGTSITNIDITTLNIDSLIKGEGIMLGNNGTFGKGYYPMTFTRAASSGTANSYSWGTNEARTNLFFTMQGDGLGFRMFDCTLILEYTKTTD